MLNYTDLGEGEELLLIHGLGSRREAWNPQLSLSINHRLIIIELRGHGNSTETTDLTIEQFAEDIVEVLNHLKIEKAHICGLSLGGLVAQEIHKRYKHRVKSLILSNTIFYIPSVLGNNALSRTRKILSLERQGEQIAELVKTCLYDKSNRLNVELVRDAFLIRDDTYLSSAQSAFGRNYFLDLFCIKIPTLIIGSIEDKVTPIFNSYTMYCAIQNARLVAFRRTGHLSNVERPREFNQAVIRHIDSYNLNKEAVL